MRKLERQDLLGVAARVAVAFHERATLRRHELNSVIADAISASSTAQLLECRDLLARSGYVWKPPDVEDAWQPGIPSLMDYVEAHVP